MQERYKDTLSPLSASVRPLAAYSDVLDTEFALLEHLLRLEQL
jgi:hypothetical protein